ncbi:hypothetical protein, partial [Pseudomonas oryzihabitans]|uniref:hypothetical protein n=1 Tax=Pseudomonas oryzihabitans TaxID=47885 RepID=UPI002B1E2E6C
NDLAIKPVSIISATSDILDTFSIQKIEGIIQVVKTTAISLDATFEINGKFNSFAVLKNTNLAITWSSQGAYMCVFNPQKEHIK